MPGTTVELKQGPDNPIRIETPLGDDVLVLVGFTGYESMSANFEITATCLSSNPGIKAADILHKPVKIGILQASAPQHRYIHGICNRISQGPSSPGAVYEYRLSIVPWLWFLTLHYDCRIFQNKNAKQIIEQIFQDRGFTDFRFRLTGGDPPTRDYCVQYRESDFNFISRLLEEEGIFYFFEHSASKHMLILANANSTIVNCPMQHILSYRQGSAGTGIGEDPLLELDRDFEVHTGRITKADYDFIKPSANLRASIHDDQKFEEYDYPGNFTTIERGDALVRTRLEEREANFETVSGMTAVRSLQPGYKIVIEDHFNDDINTSYSVVSVEHTAGPVNYVGMTGMPNYDYRNRFRALRHATKFRPPLTARRPIVEGEHTAVVVGPAGEEIYTDEYGRVKVHFHWDREGKKNETDSCWIRVSQLWAGANYGGIHIPRIGQEVIVSFLEGNPDCPIVTGRVYNDLQMPPYTLPENKTRSTIKSRSSRGGGQSNFNEIRFEDKKGSEQVFIHAENDMDIRVKHDWRTWIGHDYHRIIKGKVAQQVAGDISEECKGSYKGKIAMDRSLEVGMSQKEKFGMNLHQSVGMNHHAKVGMAHAVDAGLEIHYKSGLNAVIEAGVSLTLKVGGNFINISPAGVAIQGVMVLINSGGAAGAGGGGAPGGGGAKAGPGAKTGDGGAKTGPQGYKSSGDQLLPGGYIVKPDGTVIDPATGTAHKSEGDQILPDGTVVKPDGTVYPPGGKGGVA